MKMIMKKIFYLINYQIIKKKYTIILKTIYLFKTFFYIGNQDQEKQQEF